MILVGAVLTSLRPQQIGTQDRLTAAKEALVEIGETSMIVSGVHSVPKSYRKM